jgi:hypothetical protein
MIAGGVTALFCLFTHQISYTQWREEKASAMEGDLVPIGSTDANPKAVGVQIGPGGPLLFSSDDFAGISNSMFKFAYDAGLRITRGPKGVEISTPVRDRYGNLVGEIDSNHWKVYSNFCSDKNYDDHRIEIKDSGGHVVLQVVLLNYTTVQLQGEWHNQFGHGVRFIKMPGGAGDTFWNNPQQEEQFEQLIEPIFQYPSSRHWAELVTKRP